MMESWFHFMYIHFYINNLPDDDSILCGYVFILIIILITFLMMIPFYVDTFLY
jgi:hypothetical protein